MNPRIDEQISALLDGEISAGELDLLLARIERDAGCRDLFARYQDIGTLLQGGSVLPLNGFHRGVRDRIVAESAPGTVAATTAGTAWSRWSGWTSAAMAATVVGVAVIFGVPRVLSPAAPAPMAAAAQGGGESALRQAMSPQAVPLRVAALPPARLTAYLVAHEAYASGLSQPAWDSHVINGQLEQVAWPANRNGE